MHNSSVHSEKIFSCEECPNFFTRLTNLIRHRKSHFNKNYTCDQCNSKFSRKDYLNAHIKTHFKFRDTNSIPLTKEKFNLSCKICQKTGRNF